MKVIKHKLTAGHQWCGETFHIWNLSRVLIEDSLWAPIFDMCLLNNINKSSPVSGSVPTHYVLNWVDIKNSWWRHQMETFSVLLAICAANFILSLINAWTNGWVNNGEAGVFETPSRPLWRHCDAISWTKVVKIVHLKKGKQWEAFPFAFFIACRRQKNYLFLVNIWSNRWLKWRDMLREMYVGTNENVLIRGKKSNMAVLYRSKSYSKVYPVHN